MTVQADNIGASAWMDNKVVTVMYTGHNPAEHTSVLRRQKDGTRSSFPCPVALSEYNQHMGGVDRGDQLRGYYMTKMKSRKFYKYIYNFLVGVTITNAFILFRSSHSMSLKKFHEVLAKELIGDYCSRHRAGRGSHPIHSLPIRHFPMKNESRKRKKCQLCDDEGRGRHDTMWFCNECDTYLCHPGTADDCFLLWHKKILQ